MNRAISAPLLPAVPRKKHSPKYDADLHLTLRDHFAQQRQQLNSQVQGFGTKLASSATITLTNANHHVTGNKPISTIKVPAAFSGPVFLIADGPWSLVTGGNIALAAGPMAIGQMLALTYDPAVNRWSPVGVGAGGGGGAPLTASYATIAVEAALPNARRLAVGVGLGLLDTGSGGAITISNTGVLAILAGAGITIGGAPSNPSVSATTPTSRALFTPQVKTIADSPYTIATAQNVFLDASSSAGADFIANLPAASGSGFIVVVKKTDANAHNIAITPNGTDTIDGLNSARNLANQYDAHALIDVATGKWDIWS